jgi:hypothetical protein
MRQVIGAILRAYAALSAYVLALLILLGAVLLGTRTLTVDRLREALAVLRRKPDAAVPEKPRPAGFPSAEAQAALELKTEELRRLEDRVGARIGRLKAEQDELERRRRLALAAEAASGNRRQERDQAESDAEMAANLPILSKMDGAGIVALMKDWDDPRIVRYLRALRPGKAAEVIEAIRTDPRFEGEFRTVRGDAPPGTKSRADRLNEEFSKAP